MKPITRLLFVGAIVLPWAIAARAAEEKKPEPAPAAPAAPAAQAAEPADATQEQLEARFKATLTNATFTGRWCMLKDGHLTPDQEDKYTITSASKIPFTERWLINARVQYADHDFTAPIPVKVKWAGDTAVITVDGFGLPGGPSYSARVLIFENTYAGSWSAGDHGGLLSGVITQAK